MAPTPSRVILAPHTLVPHKKTPVRAVLTGPGNKSSATRGKRHMDNLKCSLEPSGNIAKRFKESSKCHVRFYAGEDMQTARGVTCFPQHTVTAQVSKEPPQPPGLQHCPGPGAAVLIPFLCRRKNTQEALGAHNQISH